MVEMKSLGILVWLDGENLCVVLILMPVEFNKHHS